jgi:hypothetical protein
MILSPNPSYPNSRTYVLKLHRDANPVAGKYAGLLENISTGERLTFTSGGELLALLARDVRNNTHNQGEHHHEQ